MKPNKKEYKVCTFIDISAYFILTYNKGRIQGGQCGQLPPNFFFSPLMLKKKNKKRRKSQLKTKEKEEKRGKFKNYQHLSKL